jgi:hypothetical protein
VSSSDGDLVMLGLVSAVPGVQEGGVPSRVTLVRIVSRMSKKGLSLKKYVGGGRWGTVCEAYAGAGLGLEKPLPMVKPLVAGMGGRVKVGAAGLSDEVEAGASPWFWMRCCRRRSVAVSLFWRAALIRFMTRACRWTLFPVWGQPSSLQMRLRSLLMRVRECSIIECAICCRLDAMVTARGEAGRVWARGRGVRSGRDGGVRETLGPQQRQAGEVRTGG